MKKTILAALLGATLLGGTGYAAIQQAPGRGDPMMQADANSDGILTRQEALAGADARFAQLDTNKDGQLSREEHRAGKPHHRGMHKRGGAEDGKRGAMRQQVLKRVDSNGDGLVSLAEARAMATAHFDRVDANHDGKIDRAEREAAHARMRAMRGHGGTAPADG